MITQENFVRLRTHRNNIQRYRELLETSLTVFERQYIENSFRKSNWRSRHWLPRSLDWTDRFSRPTRLSGFPRQA
jgi:hypothetical protein